MASQNGNSMIGYEQQSMTSPLFVNKNLLSKHTKERSFTENKQYSSTRTQRQPREDLSRDSSLNSGVPATVNSTM